MARYGRAYEPRRQPYSQDYSPTRGGPAYFGAPSPQRRYSSEYDVPYQGNAYTGAPTQWQFDSRYFVERRPGRILGGPRPLEHWGGAATVPISEIMTENPTCVTSDTTLTDVAKKMRDLDVGILPVVDSPENRRLLGVITDRDIVVRAVAKGIDGRAKVDDSMTRHVETLESEESVLEALELMKRERVRRVLVTDRRGRLVGIVSQADLARSFAGLDPYRELEVEEMIERVSQPARRTR